MQSQDQWIESMDRVNELLETEVGGLDPELMTVAEARARLDLYLRVQDALAVGRAALERVWGDEA